jgi:beta-phosphoglucomutase-like phosphatase (HAD superfamily)
MKAVLWDLDGTLVDSADYHFESWREALAAEGRSLTRELFEACFGLRNDRIMVAWLGADWSPDLATRIAVA